MAAAPAPLTDKAASRGMGHGVVKEGGEAFSVCFFKR